MQYPKIYLALDNCFAIKRWVEPQDWIKLTKELGFNYIEASFDNEIDGLFSPDAYMDDWFEAIQRYGKEYGVKVANFFTGYQTYRTAGLAHPDQRMVSHLMDNWLKPMTKRLGQIGAGMGFSFFAFPDKILQDPAQYQMTYENVIKWMCQLTSYAAEMGGVNICVEQMYAPQQPPWTIQGTLDFLRDCYAVNQKPVYTTVDVGHIVGQQKFRRPSLEEIEQSFTITDPGKNRPAMWLGADQTYKIWSEARRQNMKPDEAAKKVADSMDQFPYLFSFDEKDSDPYGWLEKMACYSPIIHMQQTDGVAAPHAAFTPETNKKGIIEGKKLLQAIATSYENESQGSMPPKSDEIYLSFEIFGSNTEYKYDILDKLKITSDYWHQYVPEDGIRLDQLLQKLS